MPTAACAPPSIRSPIYRPRRARQSPLYRVVEDNIESLLLEGGEGPRSRPAPYAEDSMRAFLECGVPRFGVVRFRCPSCGDSVFVPFSCKRRGACPSCDARRATISSARFVDELLPRAAYRQWVLVIPKRLRWYVNNDPCLAGELCRILSRVLTRFYADSALRAGPTVRPTAPALIEFVQRFGASVNAHVHLHAVISDGVFVPEEENRLAFIPASPTAEDVLHLSETLRRKVLRRFARRNVLPEQAAREMLNWTHSGFSLDAKVVVGPEDRAGLERLLSYCLRPVISLKRLEYRPELDLVRYRPPHNKGRSTSAVLEWTPVEFLRRFSRLIPPPRVNLVRYLSAVALRS